ncbi:uncharacterized protein [Pituophis catenifer annectens]|uniref:uncharacterized protein n=1 Tax=Pituophis catenifer annectens TaxID=94852 RepID=UPI003992BDAE
MADRSSHGEENTMYTGKKSTSKRKHLSKPEEKDLTKRHKSLEKQVSEVPATEPVVKFGLPLEFLSRPPSRFLQCPTSKSESRRQLMNQAVQHLLQIHAIEEVPHDQWKQGYYSILFVVPKRSGGWRAILDLKNLNSYIVYRRFKMCSLTSILQGIRPNDFLVSIDLMEAYLHIPILPKHRQYLRFSYAGKHFQYRALPFGLASAPRVFTKVLAVVAAHLRQQPLLGKMVSCVQIVPWAHLHARHLQWFLLPFQKKRQAHTMSTVKVPLSVRRSLGWWTSPSLDKGCLFMNHDRLVLTTDASLHGWGAHLASHVAQGRWSASDLANPINWLELKAIRLALTHFHRFVQHRHVLVLTDNIAAKAHVNRQGGTHSKRLMEESFRLGKWAEQHLLSIRADHIAGSENTQADFLSRTEVDNSEWQIHPDIFHQICNRFGIPAIDLFATHLNNQLPRFFSRFPTPGAEGVNALRLTWPPGLHYAFPPLPLIPALIRKVIADRAEIILVAPHWPRRPWFADLVSLSTFHPWRIPPDEIVLRQGNLLHPDPQWLQLTAWRLKGPV